MDRRSKRRSSMSGSIALLVALVASSSWRGVQSFLPPRPMGTTSIPSTPLSHGSRSPVRLFSDKKDNDDPSGGFLDGIFGRFRRSPDEAVAPEKELSEANQLSENESIDATVQLLQEALQISEGKTDTDPVPTVEAPSVVATMTTKASTGEMTAAERAAKLKAEAQKARLEAEKMDAVLTLNKIAKLEQAILDAMDHDNTDDVPDLKEKLRVLQAKLLGEPVTPVTKKAAPPTSTPTSSFSSTMPSSSTTSTEGATETKDGRFMSRMPEVVAPVSSDPVEISYFDKMPSFMLKVLAMQMELEYDKDDIASINKTELALRYEKMASLDFSWSKKPRPSFTRDEINEKMAELKASSWELESLDYKNFPEPIRSNGTELALIALEYEYFTSEGGVKSAEDIQNVFSDEEWLQPVVAALNKSAVDSTIESLFPKCTRKEESPIPTMAQVQQLVADVLPKASFTTKAKAEPVAGGYVIRGSHRKEDGDALIAAIDAELAKMSSLGDKMTIIYCADFTIFGDAEGLDFDEAEPILYVTGPDICREPKPVQLSTVSALGLASTWYLSIYPFLLNDQLAEKVNEQLALADANMTPDLGFLTELSVPLFCVFLSLQLLHEMGHLIMAGIHGIKSSVPTLVPSIVTGITSAVTTFKAPPKNNQAMFDFAAAGPLLGVLGSVGAILVGSQLTMLSDPSSLPALPVEVLRQSTLGGGLINAVMGNGALTVPEGALGTQAVATMTIPLHPVALAGYISLVVNALALLPVGNTDGGRMALALFGRGAKLLVGNIFLFVMLLVGLTGSDLFLFYFAFCIAFQAGNEIPSRNEVDKIDFSRVGVATTSYVIALLTLIPFQ